MAQKKKKTTKRKKSLKKKSRQGTHVLRLTLSTLFLLAFLGSCLYGLIHLRHSYPEKISTYSVPMPMEEPHQPVQSKVGFPEVYSLFKAELLAKSDSTATQRLPESDEVRRYKLDEQYPDQLRLMELSTRIALTESPAQLDLAPRKGYVRLYWNGELRVELQYNTVPHVIQQKPLVAIIMDDMGRSLSEFERLIDLEILVTPSILPHSEYATQGASLLQRKQREYLIHIPMQPASYPTISPGPNALMIDLAPEELRQRVKQYLRQVPGAAGGNNHMGSRFTLERDKMRVVLTELRDRNLFFIDSRTIAGSVGYDEAKSLGMPTGTRQIFLDNEEDVTYIRAQLKKMVRMASEKGTAIAICHPYRETFEALQKEQQWLRSQNIDFVVASRLATRH